MTLEEFKKEANEVHGGKYDYSNVKSLNQIPIQINCPKHGLFFDTPYMHLHNCGCFECYKEYLNEILNKKRGV